MNNFPNDLLIGYSAFRDSSFLAEQQRYHDLAEHGQTPATLVISCCDSRVSPEVIFQSRPGEIFVIRNVANLVPPNNPDNQCDSTAVAVEFAISVLKIQNIVVMGHQHCGGIAATIDAQLNGTSNGPFIDPWVELLKPSVGDTLNNNDLDGAELQTCVEKNSVIRSLENLRTFPTVAAGEKAGELTLYGAWFEIAGGKLWLLDKDNGQFIEP
ncbi:MAG: carbonic anhydrase [Robiginitomaculum sp.]|nr:carbonic anhydrase [Robiginitomaculum sp.]